MDLWKHDKVVEFTAQNKKTGDTLRLLYSVLDTDIGDRWIALIDKNNELNHTLRYNYRKILSPEEIEENFQEFKANVGYINAHYDRQLTEIISVEDLRQNAYVLNDLHEEYEIYGDRLAHLIDVGYFNDPKKSELYNPIWPGDTHDKVTHEAFLRLNEQIHNFEAVYRTWNNSTKSICTCLVDFMPAGLHEDLKSEDFFLFTPEHQWGWLYLGYNTLGKHWSSICHDNDVEVVKRNAVRPQQRFAAECYMNFRPHTSYDTRISLYKWWLKNNFSEIKDPRMKLEEFALGFIPVAKFHGYSINDGAIIPASHISDSQDWNLNVWSKFNSIIDFKVIDV
jgi:hypothetical protein